MDTEIIVLKLSQEEIKKLVKGTGMKVTNTDSLEQVIKSALGAFISNID